MITEKIYFQKSYQVGEFLYEHYGMLGVLEPNESIDEAYDKAREEAFRQHKRNNPHITWHENVPITEVKKEPTVYPIDLEFRQQLEVLKNQIEAIEFREDAELYLSTTEFKYNLEVKNIINQKPSKK